VSEVAEVDPLRPDRAEAAIAAAARAVGDGRLVVVPTETVYGIGCRPDSDAATARLFAAKGRSRGLNLAVLASSAGEALALTDSAPHAASLAAALWPGPLTMVLRRSARTRAWPLGEDGDTIGVRVPDQPLALALFARTGPLAVSSANRSGEPPARTRGELLAAFGDAVAVYLLTSEPLGGTDPSTVVDLTDPPRIRLARPGPFSRRRMAGALGASVPEPEWVDFPP
jgi:L-threonylcarbamoyladenylate synthase